MAENWPYIVLSLLLTLLGWEMRRAFTKLDELDGAQKKCVSKDELAAQMTIMRDERRAMHVENRQAIGALTQRIDRVLERL